jgi:hypothetical protein
LIPDESGRLHLSNAPVLLSRGRSAVPLEVFHGDEVIRLH